MEIEIKKIQDPNIQVPINHEEHKIESIKAELAKCEVTPTACEVEVMDMWDDLPEN